jgi:hypothetical protein
MKLGAWLVMKNDAVPAASKARKMSLGLRGDLVEPRATMDEYCGRRASSSHRVCAYCRPAATKATPVCQVFRLPGGKIQEMAE